MENGQPKIERKKHLTPFIMNDRPILTYQTRPVVSVDQGVVLDAYAALYGRAERSLFAAMQTGKTLNELKRVFLPEFGITARQFNAIRIALEGKVDSIKRRRPELIAEAQSRIKKAIKVIAKLVVRASGSNKLHQKRRRLAMMQVRLASMQADEAAARVRLCLCFGSKKLFRAQYAREANGFDSHADWLLAWQASRSDQFFVLGSGDESAGNQSCQASVGLDNALDLQLRLPDALSAHGKYLAIKGVRFAYGHSAIVAALQSSQRISATTKAGAAIQKRIGMALSYRFVRDAKGWRIFVSCESKAAEVVTHIDFGAVGVDVNADHLAIGVLDRFGNAVKVKRIDLCTYGKSTDQAKALIGDTIVKIVALAQSVHKPLVIEKLNFAKKKAQLEASESKKSRMLSSFACNRISTGIKAAAFRLGVEVIEINPAYTSVIGAVNYAQTKGVSVHQGAAIAIARRGLGLSERSAVAVGVVPVANGGHVTFELPVRNRSKHVWSFWSKVRTNLKAAHIAHVAHYRHGDHQKSPSPLAPAMRPLGAIWSSTMQLRGANRQQNCSADVLGDVPF